MVQLGIRTDDQLLLLATLGLGAHTLMNALEKSFLATRDVASWAVFVDAIDDDAASFCRKYGFIELPEDNHKLFLPTKTIAKLFAE